MRSFSQFILYLLVSQAVSATVTPSGPQWPKHEFRAVWIATVSDIDWPLSRTDTTAKQKADMVAMLDNLHAQRFNAIIFQVRCQGDAFYESKLEPWSADLTGHQGKPPNPLYDPLAFVIGEAHARNMEVHAWFNPYRAHAGSTSKAGLAANHMANTLPSHAHPYGKDLWMDPGAKEVQDQTYNVIMDVVHRYDVDGIHMDDYFYPYPVTGVEFPDTHTYSAYKAGGGKLVLADWRRQNVDTLIQRLYTGIKAAKNYVKFGLSPFGIWQSGHPAGVVGLSAYSAQYADSRKWFAEGWVDYFSPQLYWKLSAPHQSFTALSDWWLAQNTKQRHFYPGVYAGQVVLQNWPLSEIQQQVEETRHRASKLDLGDIFFSAKFFRDNSKGLGDLFRTQIYQSPALAPVMPWLTAPAPHVPSVTAKDGVVSWSADPIGATRSWAVYKFQLDNWDLIQVLDKDTLTVRLGAGQYAISAVNRLANQSEAVIVDVGTVPVG